MKKEEKKMSIKILSHKKPRIPIGGKERERYLPVVGPHNEVSMLVMLFNFILDISITPGLQIKNH